MIKFILVLSLLGSALFAQVLPSRRYALILEGPPLLKAHAAADDRQQIRTRQQSLRAELESRKIAVTGASDTLLNAVFVAASIDRLSELRSLPGVTGVVPLRRYRLDLNRAVTLVDAAGAWNALGGVANAGAGIKIAILDTGIDQNHPAFQDSSLPALPGFPICQGSDCAFTNNKVIVARSYVRQLAASSDLSNPAVDSRPDDYSARDRIGHGTAVASCAAGVTNTGALTITGMAPKAYLGNYKIFGSPEVNDTTTDDVIIQALEDALNDGMDIVSLSLGGPAFSGPLDSGAACGNSTAVPCDPLAQAVENAVQAGITVVVAAGNNGADGNLVPSFGTIASPGDAPSAIAAGASTNSHMFSEVVRVPGSGVPADLQSLTAEIGDGATLANPVTAPLVDVTKLGDDGLACSGLPPGSLVGSLALIERGTCTFLTKVLHAEAAGAAGVVFYMADSSALIAPGALGGTDIPAAMISNSDGTTLKSFVDSTPGQPVTIDPQPSEVATTAYNQLASFSSVGPSTGNNALKPDLVAVGTNMYMAAQSYDPFGELFGADGYTVANGTSFATPLVSGAAAMVKQSHPKFSPAQIKSALVNTATQDVQKDQSGNAVSAQAVGAGKLDAGAAIAATVTSNPATVSFGALTSLPVSQQIVLANSGSGTVVLTIAVQDTNGASGVTPAVSQPSLSLASGTTGLVTVNLSGHVPPPGSYSGAITIQDQGVSLRVPYLYLVASGVPAGIIPLTGLNFDGTVGQNIPEGIVSFKLVDAHGLPVPNAQVDFASSAGGLIDYADSVTDNNGIAAAEPILGTQPGNYTFAATVAGMEVDFSGTARIQPSIAQGGMTATGNATPGSPVVPGSYIGIYGRGLSDFTDSSSGAILPLAIDNVNVSFDVPLAGISVPGHLTYVSPSQVNVQVPWELQGQSAAQVKVTIDYSYGNVQTLFLAATAPSLFESSPGAVAALDASNRPISASNPALRGRTIQLYANGLGPVTNQPASGDPAPSSPLAQTTSAPSVTIGGLPAQVSFSGLAPGFAALYQINVTVPAGLAPGTHPISLAIAGKTSNGSGISVQ